eukprot:3265316-Alexandrium_andersonii.AAC.1
MTHTPRWMQQPPSAGMSQRCSTWWAGGAACRRMPNASYAQLLQDISGGFSLCIPSLSSIIMLARRAAARDRTLRFSLVR